MFQNDGYLNDVLETGDNAQSKLFFTRKEENSRMKAQHFHLRTPPLPRHYIRSCPKKRTTQVKNATHEVKREQAEGTRRSWA
jgi:hypothetical protein